MTTQAPRYRGEKMTTVFHHRIGHIISASDILEMSAIVDELRDKVKRQTELADYWRQRYLEAVGGLEPGCKMVIGGKGK